MTIEGLKKAEHETVEYKRDIPAEKEKYLKTAVAFANAAGGQIIFGVENNTWEIIGFSNDEVFQKMDAITNSIFDACEPSIVPIMTIEELAGKKIIVATIRPGMAKPYYLRKYGMMDGNFCPYSRSNAQGRTVHDQNNVVSYTASFEKIDDGNYVLVETIVPNGFNSWQSQAFEVEATHTQDPNTLELTALSGAGLVDTGDVSTGALTQTIQNNSGVTLPSTGGIGTTLFYVGGGILILAAVILLVTKRRMNAND